LPPPGGIQIHSTSYGGGNLEWYPIKAVVGDTDQMTVTYLLVFPGHGINGDIEGVAQLYNPPNTWTARNYKEYILEFSRLGWDAVTLTVDGKTFEFPQVMADDIVSPGYLTIRLRR
jgi:hypothetical protein